MIETKPLYELLKDYANGRYNGNDNWVRVEDVMKRIDDLIELNDIRKFKANTKQVLEMLKNNLSQSIDKKGD